ncbi:hypothetical protein QQG55_30485 [Brugia pahangi]|uniref:Coiled-coil domain-containing protein 122 n=1 Tax=Brugia pahangi TaxID=6280 RepID=A0A0N4TLW2_BRUPA|nr:unnamed protein product [Brugia pahangi]
MTSEGNTSVTINKNSDITSSNQGDKNITESLLKENPKEDTVSDEILEENKNLMAEVFDLKAQLVSLKKLIPAVVDNEGNDFTYRYIAMQMELNQMKAQKTELEVLWKCQQEKYNEEKSKLECEMGEWKKKAIKNDELTSEVRQLRQQLVEKDNKNKREFEFMLVKQRNETMKAEVAKFQHIAEMAELKAEHRREIFEEKLSKAREINEIIINERSRTCRTIMKLLKWTMSKVLPE